MKMFCTTECWDCEDKNCEHYISKTELYFKNQKLNDRIGNAINFIDQVLMYHLHDYKQLDEDCNTLIGILKGKFYYGIDYGSDKE